MRSVQKQKFYNIGQHLKLNIIKKKNEVIREPVIIKNCRIQNNIRDHIMDLIDVFGEEGS